MESNELNVMQFSAASNKTEPINIDYINGPAIKQSVKSKRKLRIDRLAIAIGATGLALLGGIKTVSVVHNELTHEAVLHSEEVPSEGIIKHNHPLDLEHFIRDYKAVNEKANKHDIELAIENGEFDHYKATNGSIEIVGKLQEEQEDSIEFYNTTCVSFADRIEEEMEEKYFSGK